jgi:anti-sigma regulatory factor (Ser/Thr protein kinase)
LIVPARFDQLQRVASFVRAHAEHVGLSGLDLNRIELAVDEACSNIIQHAYAGRSDGKIQIRVQTVPAGRLTVVLIDTGRPFDPNSVPSHDPGGALDDLKIGGLGLYLMRQTMDDITFEFDVRGRGPGEPQRFNRLTMVKTI